MTMHDFVYWVVMVACILGGINTLRSCFAFYLLYLAPTARIRALVNGYRGRKESVDWGHWPYTFLISLVYVIVNPVW